MINPNKVRAKEADTTSEETVGESSGNARLFPVDKPTRGSRSLLDTRTVSFVNTPSLGISCNLGNEGRKRGKISLEELHFTMEKSTHHLRRPLLIVVLIVGSLLIITIAASIADSAFSHQAAPQEQTVQAGPYQVTFQVAPNPPSVTQPANLSFQVFPQNSQQPILNAHVAIDSRMKTMDMGTEHVNAQVQPDGMYVAQAQFAMSGPWQVNVVITVPGQQTQRAVFTVTVH